MNYLKTLGIACLLVAATMAVAGSGTAAAEQSVLCKANETPCKSGNRYSKGTEVILQTAGLIEVYAANGAKMFGCGEPEIEAEITGAGGSAETAEIGIPSQLLEMPCTCQKVSIDADLKFNWMSGTMDGAGTEEFNISIFCPSIQFGCSFGGKVSEGITLTGGSPAVLNFYIEELPRTSVSAICGAWVNVTGEFEVATPNPLYVSTA